MTDCEQEPVNLKKCNCTYDPCPRKGKCCECLQYHRAAGQLPACYFSASVERTYDRSIAKFIATHSGKQR